ncbi:hypothetical protein [Streptomyces sp. NPDC052114]|uniref:hypothetical protein n=1 Tax=unclassified Streptomyces TaxID=2593676 RepID=UPI0034191C0C
MSFQGAELAAIVIAARRMFRAAHLRITDNTRHLAQWHSGVLARGSEAWLLGEALGCLAHTGEVPRDTRAGQRGRVLARYARVLGGQKPEHTWQRLFLTRMETVALGVLLAEHGWNLSVINRLKVPRAAPDAGRDGLRIYRVELEKHKRGVGRYFETRNLTDDGAASPGRLITQALEATVFARTAVHALRPGTDRLLIWRSGKAPLDDRPQHEAGERSGIAVFGFGISGLSAHRWASQQGFTSSPFRRGRRTVNTLHRRAPGQNSQATHDRVYALADPQVRQQAIPVIAEAAETVVATAHATVFAAELRAQGDPADQPTATANCHDVGNSPYPGPDGGCSASFLMCLACPNARIHPAHYSRLAHLHHALDKLRTALEPGEWQHHWEEGHARLEHLKGQLGTAEWTRALTDVSDTDRHLIALLLNGDLDP